MSVAKQRPVWSEPLESQFVASLEMLGNAMRACPPLVWDDPDTPVAQRFWYLAFHTLFWLDHDLQPEGVEHVPPAPFTLGELDPAGVYPDRAYTLAELLAYLDHDRNLLRAALTGLDDKTAASPCWSPGRDFSVLEMHLYSLRHVMHHTGQLQLLLRQGGATPPRWVRRGRF